MLSKSAAILLIVPLFVQAVSDPLLAQSRATPFSIGFGVDAFMYDPGDWDGGLGLGAAVTGMVRLSDRPVYLQAEIAHYGLTLRNQMSLICAPQGCGAGGTPRNMSAGVVRGVLQLPLGAQRVYVGAGPGAFRRTWRYVDSASVDIGFDASVGLTIGRASQFVIEARRVWIAGGRTRGLFHAIRLALRT
jgi:hypothetical protein